MSLLEIYNVDPWALNVFDAGMRKLAFTVIVTRKDGGPLEKKKETKKVIEWEVMTIKQINGR